MTDKEFLLDLFDNDIEQVQKILEWRKTAKQWISDIRQQEIDDAVLDQRIKVLEDIYFRNWLKWQKKN